MDLFRVRLNCIDFYQAAPSRYDPRLRNDVYPSHLAKATRVPVVRVFGSTETGQKVCAHIHGAFPYLYVEYDGGLEPEQAGDFIYRLHLSIDRALALSYRPNQYGEQQKFVARITLVKGIPFYGFSVGYSFFLKIYMYNPVVMTRLADLLQQGAIMKRRFQPYEAHLQYLLQFMTDYNLYGCDYLESSKTYFRSPLPDGDDRDGLPLDKSWHSASVPPQYITDDPALPRASHCSIEVDICVQDISNRGKVAERLLHHDFSEYLGPKGAERKLVSSMAGLWKDESRRRQRRALLDGQPADSPFPPEALVSMSADDRDSQPQHWIHEAEYREQIQELVMQEVSMLGETKLDFSNFVKPLPLEQSVRTALQSVEDLYPATLLPLLGLPPGSMRANVDPLSSIEVDEEIALLPHKDEDVFFPDDADDVSDDDAGLFADSNGPQFHPPTMKSSKPLFKGGPLADELLAGSTLRFSGMSLSAFKTGRLPSIPISAGMLDMIENHQLFDQSQQILSPASHGQLKRSSSFTPTALQSKRIKGNGDAFAATPSGSAITPRLLAPYSSQPRRSPSWRYGPKSSNPGDKADSPRRSAKRSQEVMSTVGSALPALELPSSWPSTNPSDLSLHDPPALVIPAASSLHSQNGGFEHLQNGELKYALPPPSRAAVAAMQDYGLPDVVYQEVFYGKERDVPSRKREYAGKEFRILGNTLPFLPDFDSTGASLAAYGIAEDLPRSKDEMDSQYRKKRRECSFRSWEIADPPPIYHQVEEWLRAQDDSESHAPPQAPPRKPLPAQLFSQIDGPTPRNKHGFKYSQHQSKGTSVQHEVQYMSTMSLEVHVNTRGAYVPNPELDEIQCIFWSCRGDGSVSRSQQSTAIPSGILLLCADGSLGDKVRKMTSVEVVEETSELNLIVRAVELVRTHDPDILTGYEVHGGSWGYLIERARLKYDYDLCDEFSRMKSQSRGRFGRQSDRWGFNTTSSIRITGRHMINIWRAMRGELNLLQYTMENVVWHLLHQRIPHYSWRWLTAWFQSGHGRDLHRLLRYYERRTQLDLRILEANELVQRTSEQARLLGVDFFSVFSRGSQFKVESIMFRIAKPESLMLVSPSRKQVGRQNALECLPLVMEPQSGFYSSPMVVLDFQSLYPSVMIAYNYCYSTFLGRITSWRGGQGKMGFAEYRRQQGLLALLREHINIAPNGMMYAKAEVRKSLLAKMLTEILETRIMVKSGMKQDRDDKMLQKLLNNRQLALKLLANVTYGYTSASFSGRMPCSEIADSIVQTGRETLERATAYIHSVERWGAEVVYGDTDSLFIYLKGRTREQAFEIGGEMAQAITDMNPRPVKLKFEKVYHPCVLLTKKRYVGYKWESREQAKPEFDAKGIETVRRDGTPAEQKIEEKALRILFDTADLSQIKEYFQAQCGKIMRGRVSVQDFCFAREVKLGTYSDRGVAPAGAQISTRRMMEDARAEPQYGERVPYVVVTGPPRARLVDRCVSPEELLRNPHWQLDAEYYITKNLIPPLDRIFSLVGANVRQWYDEMPKVRRVNRIAPTNRKNTLESYMKAKHCLVCGRRFSGNRQVALCRACVDSPRALVSSQEKIRTEQDKYRELVAVCRGCEGVGAMQSVECDSQDCAVFWTRKRQQSKMLYEEDALRPVIDALTRKLEGGKLDW